MMEEKTELLHRQESTEGGSGLIKPATTKKWLCIGYICNFVAMLSDSVSGSCTQALGGYVPSFELNALRFGTLWLGASVILLIGRWSILPTRHQIPGILLLCLAFNCSNYSLYEATVYLPVGEVLGFTLAVSSILVAVVTCIANKKCTAYVNIAVCISILGLVLLAQPRFLFHGSYRSVTYPVCYKDDLGRRGCRGGDTANTQSNTSDCEAMLHLDLTKDVNTSLITSSTPVGQHYNKTSGVTISNELKGYTLVVIGGVSYSVMALVPRMLLTNSNPFLVIFWIATSGVLVSSGSSGVMVAVEVPTFPGSTTCVLLVVGHMVFAALTSLFSVPGYLLLYPPLSVLIRSSCVLILAIVQNTALGHVNPGHRNVLEYIGFALVFIGLIVGPVYQLYKRMLTSNGKKHDEQDVENSVELTE